MISNFARKNPTLAWTKVDDRDLATLVHRVNFITTRLQLRGRLGDRIASAGKAQLLGCQHLQGRHPIHRRGVARVVG
jgi:hypothetical protein